MKNIILLLLLLFIFHSLHAQQTTEDSLQAVVSQHNEDKAEVSALLLLASRQEQLDSAMSFAQKGLALAKAIGDIKGMANGYLILQGIYGQLGNFGQAIKYTFDALTISEKLKDNEGIVASHGMLQAHYRSIRDFQKSLSHAFLSLQTAEAYNLKGTIIFPGQRWTPLIMAEIGQTFILMNQLDSAFLYTKKSIAQKELFNGVEWGFPVYLLATIETMKGSYKAALKNYRSAFVLSIQNGNAHDTLQVFSGMSTLFKKWGEFDSAIHYAKIVAQGWKPPSEYKNLLESVNNLAGIYKMQGSTDSTLKYMEMQYAIKDSIFSAEKEREVQGIAFNAKLKEEEIKADQARYKTKVQLYVLIAGILVLILVAAILWRNNNQKQKANAKIEKAFRELKQTQQQLIQQEKLASLGELTAGIAHEIQNPLNFVNNFSDVNTELLEELQKELMAGNAEEAILISNDLKENEQKISHHGKRADAIVKGMLQHTRANTGKKEPTNINALAEEYLRLSYHGLKAKDKDFNANFITDFDNNIGKVIIMPQDIGRVFLNLFNNAFYTVNEKQRQLNGSYKPTISVTTKRINANVEIRIKDNGNGIPQNIKDKIFQPFFTTKPTGQGTGLGLSLSYDVVKAHGGELKVKSKEGEGSEFIIELLM